MKPKEYLALALRIIGVLVILYGIRDLIDFPLGLLGYFTLQRTAYAYYLILGIGYLVVGLYLLRGAPHLVRFAYPEREKEESENIELNNQDDA